MLFVALAGALPAQADTVRVRRPPELEVVTVEGSRFRVSQGQTARAAIEVTVRSRDAWMAPGLTLAPPARRGSALAFDPVRERLVLFGGRTSSQTLDDTWEWNGSAWSRIASASSPSARADHAMAYDPVAARVTLFGGSDGVGVMGDTWEFDGSQWRQSAASPSPPARTQHAMATMATSQGIVLFGGRTATDRLGDMWLRRNGSWISVAATDGTTKTTAPSPRFGHGMAPLDRRSSLILYGGSAKSGVTTETWEYDGSAWNLLGSVPKPGRRVGFRLVADPVSRSVVLFGGLDALGNLQNDLLAFDGNVWRARDPDGVPEAPAPAGRLDAAVAFDERESALLLFGGASSSESFADTWSRRSQPTADRLTASVQLLGDEAGYAIVPAPGNADRLEPGEGTTLTFGTRIRSTAALGPRTFAAVVSARDLVTGSPATVTGQTTGSWIVESPAAIRVASVALSRGAAAPGETGLVLSVNVENRGPARFRARADQLSVQPRFNGQTAGFRVTAAADQPQAVSEGASELLTFELELLPDAPPGATQLTILAAAIDANSGLAATVESTTTTSLVVQAATQIELLSFVLSPSAAVTGQTSLTAQLTVRSTGPPGAVRPVRGLKAALSFGGREAGFDVAPATGNATALAAGETRVLTFTVDVRSGALPGRVTLRPVLSATDAVTGGTVQLLGSPSASLDVLTPLALTVREVRVRPIVSLGMRAVALELIVRNTGVTGLGAAADALAARLLFNGGTESFAVTPLNGNPDALEAGATATLRYALDIGATAPLGATVIGAEVSARDRVSGAALEISTGAAARISVQEPATVTLRELRFLPPTAVSGQVGLRAEIVVQAGGSPGAGPAATGVLAGLSFDDGVTGLTALPAAGNPRTLSAGSQTTLTLTLDLARFVAPGVYRVRAALAATDADTGLSAVVLGEAEANLSVTPAPSVSLSLGTVVSSVSRGQTFEVVATLKNEGVRSVTLSAASLQFDRPGLQADLPTGLPLLLAAGQSTTIAFRASVDPTAAGGAARGSVAVTVTPEAGDAGAATAAFTLDISVPPAPIPPIARIQLESAPDGGPRLVILDASQSRDPDAASFTGYSWGIDSAPSGAELATTSTARFLYDAFLPGSYRASLEVRNASGLTSSTFALFNVDDVPPVVRLGADRSIVLRRPGAAATHGVTLSLSLDGSQSRDPNRLNVTYAWRLAKAPDRPDASADSSTLAQFSSRTTSKTVVLFDGATTDGSPAAPMKAGGAYSFSLTVADGTGRSTGTVNVVAVDPANLLPAADAGPDRVVECEFLPGGSLAPTLPQPIRPGEASPQLAAFVRLDGRESADPSGRRLTYSWRIASKPASSTVATLTDEETPFPAFVPDVEGRFELELVVHNGLQASRPDRTLLLVQARGRNRPPTALAMALNLSRGARTSFSAPRLEIETGVRVALDASFSSDDESSSRAALRYQWRQAGGPPVSLEPNDTSTRVTFVPTQPGDHEFRLAATDIAGATDEATVTVRARRPGTPVRQALSLTAAAGSRTGEALPESGFFAGLSRSLRVTAPATITMTGLVDAAFPPGQRFDQTWRQLSGPTVLLTPSQTLATTSLSSMTSFPVTTSRVYEFELTVTPAGAAPLTRRIRVVVDTLISRVPVAVLRVASPTLGRGSATARSVTLDARQSDTAQPVGVSGQVVSYAWRQLAGPRGRFSAPLSEVTSFEAPELGDDLEREYAFELTVDSSPPGDRSEPAMAVLTQPASVSPATTAVQALLAGRAGSGGGCALAAQPTGNSAASWALLGLTFLLGRLARRRGGGAGSWGEN